MWFTPDIKYYPRKVPNNKPSVYQKFSKNYIPPFEQHTNIFTSTSQLYVPKVCKSLESNLSQSDPNVKNIPVNEGVCSRKNHVSLLGRMMRLGKNSSWGRTSIKIKKLKREIKCPRWLVWHQICFWWSRILSAKNQSSKHIFGLFVIFWQGSIRMYEVFKHPKTFLTRDNQHIQEVNQKKRNNKPLQAHVFSV